MSDCYICFESINEIEPLQDVCACKGSIRLHKKCFNDLLDYGFDFCNICGSPWKQNSTIESSLDSVLLRQVIIRKNGKKSIYNIDKLGRIQGECKVYFLPSNIDRNKYNFKGLSLFSKSYYKDNKLEGKYIEYFSPRSGDQRSYVLMESNFKDGVANGLCRWFYKPILDLRSSDLRIETSGEIHGPLCEECFYKDGKQEGLCQTFYDPKSLGSVILSCGGAVKSLELSQIMGKIVCELKNYKNGKLNGKYQKFDIHGRIIIEGNYDSSINPEEELCKKGVWKSYTYY